MIIKILFTQEYTSIRKEGEIKYTKIVIFKLISNIISRMEILTLWLLNFVNIAKFVRWLHEQVVKNWFDWSDILMHPLLTHWVVNIHILCVHTGLDKLYKEKIICLQRLVPK